MGRWIVRGGAVLAVLLVVAWIFRVELFLGVVGMSVGLGRTIGPHQEIEWQRGPEAATAPPSERPPNIVLILADDMGWNDVSISGGGAGGGTVQTPNIDSIARSGVNLTWGYSGNGSCAPSRAAILSGRYGTRFGFEFTPTPAAMAPALQIIIDADSNRKRKPVPSNTKAERLPMDEMGMPSSEITLAETLKAAGYHTAHIGKWHVGRTHGMGPNAQGFDETLMREGPLFLPVDHPRVVNSRQEFDAIDRFLWTVSSYSASYNDGPLFEPPGYLTDYYTDEAIKVIEANRPRPFFLYLAHWAIHTPLQARRDDYDAFPQIESHTERTYAGMIRSLDRSVGRVLDALREQGLEENTLVIFTSDNGGAGYLGLPRVNEPFRGWKLTFFEGGVHVPFMMSWPAKIPAGQTYHQPVHHFDIYATAAAAAGAALPADRKLDGVDLVPFVQGKTEGVPHETLFWTQDHYRVVLHRGWKLTKNGPADEFVWLFDLNEDPTEQHNLAESRPEKVRELNELLRAHLDEQVPPLWPTVAAMPVAIDKHLNEPEEPGDEFVLYPN